MLYVWVWVLTTWQGGRLWFQPKDLSTPVQPDTIIHYQLNNPDYSYGLDIAYDSVDQVYLAVWHDYREGKWKIWGTLFRPDGSELTPGGFKIYDASIGAAWPAVVFTGTHFLVAFRNDDYDSNGDVFGVRVTPDGTVLDPNGFLIAYGSQYPYGVQMARIEDKVLAVWHEMTGSYYRISGALLRPTGNVEKVFVIGESSYNQDWPSVATDTSRFLVCWMDYRSSRWDIYCNFVDTTGVLSNGTGGFALATGSQDYYPDVAYNPRVGTYLVVWESNRPGYWQIYGRRVLPDGTIVDPSVVRLGNTTTNQYFPGVLGGPDTLFTVLVPLDYRNGGAGDAYAFRLTGDLVRVDTQDIVLSLEPQQEGRSSFHPPVVMDNGGIVFGWAYGPTSGNPTQVQVTRRSLDLSTDLWGGVRSLDWQSEAQRSIVFARATHQYLAVWSAPDTTGDVQIWGRLFTLGGFPLGNAFIISAATGTQQYPQAVFDAQSGNFLVVWEDYRNGTDWDIYGARVDTLGNVLDPAGLALVSVTGNQKEPAISVSDTTVPRFFLVWSDNRSGNWNILGKFYNEFGVPVTGDLNIGVASNTQEKARVAYAPHEHLFFVVWEDYRSSRWDLYFNRIDLAGNVLNGGGGSALYAFSYNTRRPDIVWTGSRFLVAWEDNRNGNWDIMASRVSPYGMVMDPYGVPIAAVPGDQVSVRLAWLQGHAMAVWQDGRNGQNDLYGALLDANAQPDTEGGNLLVSNLGVNGALLSPNDYPNWVASVLSVNDSTFVVGYEQFHYSPYNNRRVSFEVFRDRSPFFIFNSIPPVIFVGDTLTLSWETQGILERLNIEGSPDGETWTGFAMDYPNTGSLQVTLPNNPSRAYRFKLTSTGPWQVQTVSEPVVLMRYPVWQYPLSRDTLTIGDTVVLQWQSTGIGGPVQLEVSYDDGKTWTLIHSYVPDSGNFKWVVSGTPTTTARFRIVHQDYSIAQEISGQVVIQSRASVQLLTPNGGDTLYVGDNLTVQWLAHDIQQVALLLSADSGLTYLTVAPSLNASTGSYAWIVPDYPTPYGKMRIQDAYNPALFDESDAFFTISQPLKVVYPNGGEIIEAGSQLTVEWTILRQDLVDSVDLFFSRNNGQTWTMVANGIPATQGHYTFTLPNEILDSCLVEVRHHSRGWLIHDASDGTFHTASAISETASSTQFKLSIKHQGKRIILSVSLPESDHLNFWIRNPLGQTIWHRTLTLNAGLHYITLPKLPRGVYMVEAKGKKEQKKLRWINY